MMFYASTIAEYCVSSKSFESWLDHLLRGFKPDAVSTILWRVFWDTDGNKYNVTTIQLVETDKMATEIKDIVQEKNWNGLFLSITDSLYSIYDRQHEKPPQVLLNSLTTLWW